MITEQYTSWVVYSRFLFCLCQVLVVEHGIFACDMWDLVPWSRNKPEPLTLKCGVLATRPPGKPLYSVQFSSVAQSCLILCDPMNHSTPGLPVHHQLPESTQTLIHWVSDAIQTSHPLSFSSCPQSFPASGCFQMSQLFTSGGQSIGVSASASVLPMNTQDWSPLGWTGPYTK